MPSFEDFELVIRVTVATETDPDGSGTLSGAPWITETDAELRALCIAAIDDDRLQEYAYEDQQNEDDLGGYEG